MTYHFALFLFKVVSWQPVASNKTAVLNYQLSV